ncbi:hypothetical protein [Myxococcus qinghaiensis]|uniref:hypothetical protein n=1 Tax=Myxococcus qinghaiensis TaxID=2906758 RepID=UPI0020A7B386|nr:hypothetical protein [Myxococcus qinghaiensis]MCP3167311.1 hypothetical protein [Myxococcus qinghaiensis]
MADENERNARTGGAQAAGAQAAKAGVKAAGDAARHNVKAHLANEQLAYGEKVLNQIGSKFAKASDAQLGGRAAEAAHAATFNADAVMKGQPLRARTTFEAGCCLDTADVEILRRGKVVDNAQLKYHSTPESTAKALSRPKYTGQQKVAPSDQLGGVEQTAHKEALRNQVRRPAQAANYKDTARRASDRVKSGAVESKPLDVKGAKKLGRAARAGQAKLDRVPTRSVAMEIGSAAREAAVAGGLASAGVSAIVSGVGNAFAVSRGEMSVGQALKATGKDTGVAALDGAAKAATGAALKAGVTAIAKSATAQGAKAVLGSVARSNGAFAVAAVVVDAAAGGYKVATGELSGGQYVKRVGKSASGAAGGWGGASAGAVLGSAVFPGVGTLVGGVLGGIAGAVGASAAFDSVVGGDD